MSVYTNALRFWNEFKQQQEILKKALIQQDYPTLETLIDELNEMVTRDTGCHLIVEYAYEAFELSFDTGPNKTSQYLASYFVSMAPDEVRSQWIINACLPPLSQKAVQTEVRIKENVYYLNDFTVFYQVDTKNQMFICHLYCPGYTLIDVEERKTEMSMYLIELAVGQTAYESYIADIDFLDQPDPAHAFCNLIELYDVIMDRVESEGWKAYRSPLDIYSVYQPNQDIVHDSLRKDMKLIFTTHPLLIEESLENQTDTVSDLQAKGGKYIYMYYVHPFEGKENALFRQNLAKRLSSEMQHLHIGQVIGGAIGKSYGYIDWIIYDESRFESAFQNIKKQFESQVKLYYQPF